MNKNKPRHHSHKHHRPHAQGDTRGRHAELPQSTRHKSHKCDPIHSLYNDNNTFHSYIACHKSIAQHRSWLAATRPRVHAAVSTRSVSMHVLMPSHRSILVPHLRPTSPPIRSIARRAVGKRPRVFRVTNETNRFSTILHPLLESLLPWRRPMCDASTNKSQLLCFLSCVSQSSPRFTTSSSNCAIAPSPSSVSCISANFSNNTSFSASSS
jgi:hypothetical protein